MSVDKLREYGLEEMTEEGISDFLSNQGVGVLGLATEGAPYLVPMSFGYDADERLYFTYFVGAGSRKMELTRQAEEASFLVYSAESVFSWESVLLTGSLEEVPEDQWDEHGDALENAWHLDIFQEADTAGELRLYEFQISRQEGIRHAGLPPGMQPK